MRSSFCKGYGEAAFGMPLSMDCGGVLSCLSSSLLRFPGVGEAVLALCLGRADRGLSSSKVHSSAFGLFAQFEQGVRSSRSHLIFRCTRVGSVEMDSGQRARATGVTNLAARITRSAGALALFAGSLDSVVERLTGGNSVLRHRGRRGRGRAFS